MVALSVPISARISPRSTWSPGCFSQRARVPSCIVSLKRGMVSSGIGARLPPELPRLQRLVDDPQQVAGVGQGGQFGRLRVGQRHLGRRDPPDRRVEIVEGALLDAGSYFGPNSVAEPVLFRHHRAIGLADRADD